MIETPASIVADRKSVYGLRTYISLFSSAGIGCYGFKLEGFQCIASVELLEKRLKIQRYNNKCTLDSGYICGDMTQEETHNAILREYDLWHNAFGIKELDVLIATPPCQGMSVANHKKGNELKRNSLVVESITMVKRLKPRFFIFENVRAFLRSICTDVDGVDKSIESAIDSNLSGDYNILYKVVNFKDYGCPSSRTRTLVIGVRKDQLEVTPYDIFPDKQPEKTLRETIGHLPSLHTMGEIWTEDIYHNFRNYDPRMIAWIENIKEGQSAFDNTEIERLPHTIKDGVVVFNANKNGDKYTRQYWDKVAPCIHTRNDIMASQNTVHPCDNRVFSIREVMLMMSVPDSFNWTDKSFAELNAMIDTEKVAFLKKEEMNIRQNLGEAVPTTIFRQIAHKIRKLILRPLATEQEVESIIKRHNLTSGNNLLTYLNDNIGKPFATLSKIAELSNAMRSDNAAYYTRQDLCFSIIKNLPDTKGHAALRILEPSIGVGNFLPMLIAKYSDVPDVTIDVVDIDPRSIETLRILIKAIEIPSNFTINFLQGDFLLMDFKEKYDIVIGNPPYMKISKDKKLLALYKHNAYNTATNNIFSFFIEKALSLGDTVSLIVPKSLINSPEFNRTRELLNRYAISCIIDFGEKGFKGVKIETISFIVNTKKKPGDTKIESYITNDVGIMPQSYVTDSSFPYWLIYRNADFDAVANEMQFGIFNAYRDRAITQSKTKKEGNVRVLKSRNIADNEIIDIPGYDTYTDSAEDFDVSKYMNLPNCVLVPNLTYNPRACFLPKNCIADGSVAILTTKDPNTTITSEDLAFFATTKFIHFYAIARNRGTRSLNIDNNSVFFFGKLKSSLS
ncbi:MAG: restriction endonuclease [Candidatus Amulumruptor caecigallinarius]|nr:MAG: restriction endonuclease [Candidatus Amulumruptor caecigallinarius]